MLNIHCRKLFFFAHIQSTLDYASSVWDNCSDQNMKQIRSIHRRSLKVITAKKKILPEDYRSNKILPLAKRHKFNKGTTMFKCVNDLAPANLTSMFSYKNERDKTKLYVPLPRIDLFKSSLKFSGASLWNTLPLHIQQSSNLNSFRRKYFDYLLKAPN